MEVEQLSQVGYDDDLDSPLVKLTMKNKSNKESVE